MSIATMIAKASQALTVERPIVGRGDAGGRPRGSSDGCRRRRGYWFRYVLRVFS